MARINPELPSDSRKVPSPEELAAIRAQAGQIAVLWRMNGVATQFAAAGRARQRALLVDPNAYQRPGGRDDAPIISVGDLVEATAEPGLRRIAQATGSTLLVRPEIFLADQAGAPLGGRVDELDFLMIGQSEVRVVSAKTERRQFVSAVDRRKLDLIRQVPDNPGAFGFIRNWMGWGDQARAGHRAATAGVVVRYNGDTTVRVADFRSRFLGREQTRRIVVEPVHPKHQQEDPAVGHQLRVDLPDLIEIYIEELKKVIR